MEQDPDVLVRVLSEETIRGIVGTLPLHTSCRLNWPGVEVHRYRLPNSSSSEFSYPYLSVYLPHPETPCRAEMRIGGQTMKAVIDENSVNIVPPGQPRTVRRFSAGPMDLTAIFLDPLSLTQIARAETGVDFPEIVPQFGINDPLIHSIGMILDAELTAQHPVPRVYAESLVTALAAHIFARYTRREGDEASHQSLHWRELRRSMEFINENLDKNLRLSDLAAVANMSKYHFATSFRQAVGTPPHRYQVKMRMEKARKLLKDRQVSLEEVAFQVGYTDKRQFSEQFQKIVGTTPGRYRDAG